MCRFSLPHSTVWYWNYCQWRVLNQDGEGQKTPQTTHCHRQILRWKRTVSASPLCWKGLNRTGYFCLALLFHSGQNAKLLPAVFGKSLERGCATKDDTPTVGGRLKKTVDAPIHNSYPVFCLMRKPDRCKPPSVHPTLQGLFKRVLGFFVETWGSDGLPPWRLYNWPRPGDELTCKEDKQIQPPTEAVALICDEGALSRLEEISLLKAPWGLGLTWSLCPTSGTTSCPQEGKRSKRL